VSIHSMKPICSCSTFSCLILDLRILSMQACVRYDQSVQLNWNNPQVLQLQSLCRSCYWSIIFCVLSPTFCSYKLSPNFTAINSRVARVSFMLIERCQCWVEVTEAFAVTRRYVFLIICSLVGQALNNWGLALQVDLLNCLNCLVWRFSTVHEVIYRLLGYATLHHSRVKTMTFLERMGWNMVVKVQTSL
jgi:hypothetical protein